MPTDTKYRTVKIPLRLTAVKQSQVKSLMACERWLYNEAIAAMNALSQPVYPIGDGGAVMACWLHGAQKIQDTYLKSKQQDKDKIKLSLQWATVAAKERDSYAKSGEVSPGHPVREYRKWESFDAWQYFKSLCEVLPNPKRGNAKSNYGVSAKTASAMCRMLRGQVSSFFTKRKKGDFRAKLPNRFRSADTPQGWLWTVPDKECRWLPNGQLQLGCKNQVGGFFVVNINREWQNLAIQKAQVSLDQSRQFWLHLSYEVQPIEDNRLNRSAGIDLGQKRAIAITLNNGRSAQISGQDITKLKARRDRITRKIQRKRSRAFRGQIRHFLSADEQQTMRSLEAKSPGSGTKYAHRMVAQRRREDGLRRRSRRDYRLLLAQRKLATKTRRSLVYANHCITRKATDWLIHHSVGSVFVGDVGTVPKRRRKGATRIKQVRNNVLWESGTQIKYLTEKLEMHGATLQTVPEHYTSQTCPNCGTRHKPRNRRYHCRNCGWTGDRDAVGSANILAKSLSSDWPATGQIKPLSMIALAVSPAIAKQPGRKLRRFGHRCQLNGRPSREVACLDGCDSLPRTSVREPVDVSAGRQVIQPRNPCLARNPAGKGAKEVRAIAETLTLFELPGAQVTHNDLRSSPKPKTKRRSAQAMPQSFAQLDLWSAAPETG